jgi:hypothetical protein
MPIWKRDDILPGKSYCLALCQKGEERYVQLIDRGVNSLPSSVVFVTDPISYDLLVARDLAAIASSAKLAKGDSFAFTSRGVWMTGQEMNQFMENGDPAEVRWTTEVPPRLAWS